MKRNESKEKHWLKNIKEVSKNYEWKFKRNFIFKVIGNLYLSSYFYIDQNDNVISGWSGYKSISIDNVFWDIIDELPNKDMPMSFRAEAAFCVREVNYFNYKKFLKDELNPIFEIQNLIKSINEKAVEKSKDINPQADLLADMLEDEESNCVGIITSFIEQGEIDHALSKIKEYELKGFSSRFRFGSKSFYDLAKEYCEKIE